MNNATVGGTTTITDVAPSTFTNNGTLGAVDINDDNGIRFVNSVDATVGTVTIDALNGQVLLEGSIQNVVVAKTATITVTGTISTLIANANVSVLGDGTVVNSSGIGEITFEPAGELFQKLKELIGKRISSTESGFGYQFSVDSSTDSYYDINMGFQEITAGDALWLGEITVFSGNTANFNYSHIYDDTNTVHNDGSISLEDGSLVISYRNPRGEKLDLIFDLQTGLIE